MLRHIYWPRQSIRCSVRFLPGMQRTANWTCICHCWLFSGMDSRISIRCCPSGGSPVPSGYSRRFTGAGKSYYIGIFLRLHCLIGVLGNSLFAGL